MKCSLKSTSKNPQAAFSAKSAGRFDGQVEQGRVVYTEIFYQRQPVTVECICIYRLGLNAVDIIY